MPPTTNAALPRPAPKPKRATKPAAKTAPRKAPAQAAPQAAIPVQLETLPLTELETQARALLEEIEIRKVIQRGKEDLKVDEERLGGLERTIEIEKEALRLQDENVKGLVKERRGVEVGLKRKRAQVRTNAIEEVKRRRMGGGADGGVVGEGTVESEVAVENAGVEGA